MVNGTFAIDSYTGPYAVDHRKLVVRICQCWGNGLVDSALLVGHDPRRIPGKVPVGPLVIGRIGCFGDARSFPHEAGTSRVASAAPQ